MMGAGWSESLNSESCGSRQPLRSGPRYKRLKHCVTHLAQQGRPTSQLKIQRYEEVLDGMRRLLETELRHTLQTRAAHAAELQVLLCGGRTMHSYMPLSACPSLGPGSILNLTGRLLGGGGDGGSTGAESRSCYLEMYLGKKPDKVNPAEELLARWTRCHMTGADLRLPCVIDEVGNLYNKDSVLQALLTKTMPGHLSYITGLKSVTDLKLDLHPEGKKAQPAVAAKGIHQPGNDCDFCCPITGLEFNGRFKFLVHRPSGRVVAEKAVKELPSVVQELLGCVPKAEDWIPVNPSGEQQEQLKVRQAALMTAEREKKARKAAAKLAAASGASGSAPSSAIAAAQGKGSDHAKHGHGHVKNGHVTGSPAASLPVGKGDSRKRSPSPEIDGSFCIPAVAPKTVEVLPPAKKIKGTTVYKSLFTSSLKQGPGGDAETYCCRSVSQRGLHMG